MGIIFSRTAEETAIFKRGLAVMGFFYASIFGTAVVQLKAIPPRPKEFDGCVNIYNCAEDETALRARLSVRFGAVTECTVAKSQAFIRFETHDVAVSAVRELTGACTQLRAWIRGLRCALLTRVYWSGDGIYGSDVSR